MESLHRLREANEQQERRRVQDERGAQHGQQRTVGANTARGEERAGEGDRHVRTGDIPAEAGGIGGRTREGDDRSKETQEGEDTGGLREVQYPDSYLSILFWGGRSLESQLFHAHERVNYMRYAHPNRFCMTIVLPFYVPLLRCIM